MTLTFDELVARKLPMTATIRIALDSDAAAKLEEADQKFQNARFRTQAAPNESLLKQELEKASDELEDARKAAEAESVEFKFQSIGRLAYEQLIDDHPATADQKKRAEKKSDPVPPWDLDEFPVALIHACLSEPKLTLDQVRQIWTDDNWNESELLGLFLCAQEVNQNRRVIDLKKD